MSFKSQLTIGQMTVFFQIYCQAAISGVYGGPYGEPEWYGISISLAKQNGSSMNHPIMFYPCYEYLLHT